MKEGERFTALFEISPEIVVAFGCLFQDQNPMHINDAFAKKHGFPKKIVYGNILNGFLSAFIGERLPVKSVLIHWQKIFYCKPVFCGDTVRLEATVENVSESVGAVQFQYRFISSDGQVVAKGHFQIGLLLEK
ncbi:MAG: MaoC/PaaZ C-terminal domain-containing protein [archaeon]